MHCDLLISGLFPAPAQTRENDPLFGAASPALQTMLSRSRLENSPATDAQGWLCEAFGIPRRDDYPVGSLRLLADGGEPGDAFWFCADPVHLAPERDKLVLSPASPAPEESEALVAALNRHFGDDGLHFVATAGGRWFLRLDRPPAVATFGPCHAMGVDVRPWLPHGPDALRWRALLNEIQMLLFDHPVNTAREARGEPPVNSVWPWGGGTLPGTPRRPFEGVWATDATALGLARLAEVPRHALPADARDWLGQAGAGRHLLVLDALHGPACMADAHAWRAHLTELERAWFVPLKQALRGGRIQLTLHAPGAGGTTSFSPSRASLWRVWQPARDLAHFRRTGN